MQTIDPVRAREQVDEERSLFVGQSVLIRRTNGAKQRATVRKLLDGREYMAPELLTFQVEFICDTTGQPAIRWCSAFDLLAWPVDWARRTS